MRNSRIVRENVPAQNTRLPLIGRIRCGMKQKNSQGKEYPVSLEYFIATGNYSEKFNEIYTKPEKIQIIFISDDDFQSCYEEWDGRDEQGRKAGYGDGETYHLWNYGASGDYRETADRNEVTEFSKKYKIRWKQVLTINFIIPAIKGVFGVWQLQTSGDKSSINAIRNTYDEIKELAGTVVNIPFDLCVKKATSNKPESKTVYPVITLVPNISAENMETLRSFYEAGLDIRKQGILTDKKLNALQQHDAIEIKAIEETAENHEEKPEIVFQNYGEKVIEIQHQIKEAKTRSEMYQIYINNENAFDEKNTELEFLKKEWRDKFESLPVESNESKSI